MLFVTILAIAEQVSAKANNYDALATTLSKFQVIGLLVKFMPLPIIAILNTLSYLGRLYYDNETGTDETVADTKRILREEGFLKSKDLVLNVASMPMGKKE